MKFYVTVRLSNTHFITKSKRGRKILENDIIMLFHSRQHPLFSQRSSTMPNWLKANRFIEKNELSGPQALQLWTRWTITSGAPWKSASRLREDIGHVDSRSTNRIGGILCPTAECRRRRSACCVFCWLFASFGMFL